MENIKTLDKEAVELKETLGEKLFREEAEAARGHMDETGIYFTYEEVDEWLASWGRENEKPCPVWKGK